MSIIYFGPYDEPLDLPITDPMQCELCKSSRVTHVAQMSFDGERSWVGFGCYRCITRWLDGPIRQVTYSGLTPEEAAPRDDN